MRLEGRVAVVTGAASGIGAALCRRFAAEGARGIVASDIDGEGAAAVAAEITTPSVETLSRRTDVANREDVDALVAAAEKKFGQIDLFCSNAGIFIREDGDPLEMPVKDWQHIFDVNLMAHVHAARAVLPGMLSRGEGYLLNTASAAGLLSAIGSASYSVTKHAAVGYAEWLAIEYGDRGIRVSLLCPQAVRTGMTADLEGGGIAGLDGMITAEEAAECVVQGLDSEQFLILPHPEVVTYMQRKTGDYDRWLRGMRRLRDQHA